MQYKELIPLLIGHALARLLNKSSDVGNDPLIPPHRRKVTLLNQVGKIHLPNESYKVLSKLSQIYGVKEIEIAELLLQAILNTVPISEMCGVDKLAPEQVVDLLSDSLVLDKNVHKTKDNTKARQRAAERNKITEELEELLKK